MQECRKFYINGEWVDPSEDHPFDVINPSTETVCARISLGGQEDVDAAVDAASKAFAVFGRSSREERLELLESIIAEYKNRYSDIAEAISQEMGAPMTLAICTTVDPTPPDPPMTTSRSPSVSSLRAVWQRWTAPVACHP